MDNRALVTGSTTTGRLVRGWCRPAAALVTLAVGALAALAIASALALAIATTLGAVHAVIETPPLRRRRAMRAARKGRRRRRERRELRLEQAHVPSDELGELDRLVEEVADLDQNVAIDTEPLLDRYVEAAIAKRRCASALDRAEPSRLEARLAIARQQCHPNGAAVLERRIALSHQLDTRVRALDESLSELVELVRHLVERASIPDVSPLFECDAPANCLEHYDACESLEKTADSPVEA